MILWNSSNDDLDRLEESDDEDVWRQLDEANAARTRQQKREEKILESDDDFSDSGDDDDGSSDDEDRNPKRQKRWFMVLNSFYLQ